MVAVVFPVAGQCVVVGAFLLVCSWRWLVRRLSALESVSGLVVFGGWPVETGLCCAWSGKKYTQPPLNALKRNYINTYQNTVRYTTTYLKHDGIPRVGTCTGTPRHPPGRCPQAHSRGQVGVRDPTSATGQHRKAISDDSPRTGLLGPAQECSSM